MNSRKLGTSGLSVSEIALGNWITHGAQVDDQTAHACVHAALDAGITTFDTADLYSDTRAEAVLSQALKGGHRESIELCTKVCHPTGTGPNDRGLSRKHIMEACHASLNRLQTDYIKAGFRKVPELRLRRALHFSIDWQVSGCAPKCCRLSRSSPLLHTKPG